MGQKTSTEKIEILHTCEEQSFGGLCYKRCDGFDGVDKGTRRWSAAQCGSSINSKYNEHCNTNGGAGDNGVDRPNGCIKMEILEMKTGEKCPNSEGQAQMMGTKAQCEDAARAINGAD